MGLIGLISKARALTMQKLFISIIFTVKEGLNQFLKIRLAPNFIKKIQKFVFQINYNAFYFVIKIGK